MTCSSIKIIYLTILWTLTCPLLHCFSLLNANYIVFLTSIQTLQAASLTLSVPEENYDKITKILKKNPSLLNKLIEQAENPKPQIPLVLQGGRLNNGLSSFLTRPFSGLPTYNNPVTVAPPTETMIGGPKFVLTNRASLYGNLLKKLGSAIVSPVTKSFNYFKNLGVTQGITKNALKFISNKFENKDGNQSEEEEEEEEEERPKKSKKKNAKKDKKNKSSISDVDDASSDEDEKPKDKQKKGADKKKDKNKNKSPEKSNEEKGSDEDDKSSDEEEENPGRKKDPKKKKTDGGNSKSDDDKSSDADDDKSGDTDDDNSGDTDDDKSDTDNSGSSSK